VYLGQQISDCLNPPCQVGGSIVVNGQVVQLAADVQVQGVGDNRIVRRLETEAFYSIYAIPADFIVSGATPASLYESWTTRLEAEAAVAQAGTPAPAAPLSPFTAAGFGGNLLLIAAVAGVGLALLTRKGGR